MGPAWQREGYRAWIEPETWIFVDRPLGGNVLARVRKDPDGWRAVVRSLDGEVLQAGPFSFEDAKAKAQRRVEACPGLTPLN